MHGTIHLHSAIHFHDGFVRSTGTSPLFSKSYSVGMDGNVKNKQNLWMGYAVAWDLY
jgi:hypothetical protein